MRRVVATQEMPPLPVSLSLRQERKFSFDLANRFVETDPKFALNLGAPLCAARRTST
jgi:hypothetical protein